MTLQGFRRKQLFKKSTGSSDPFFEFFNVILYYMHTCYKNKKKPLNNEMIAKREGTQITITQTRTKDPHVYT